jgi:hypothetical protein
MSSATRQNAYKAMAAERTREGKKRLAAKKVLEPPRIISTQASKSFSAWSVNGKGMGHNLF